MKNNQLIAILVGVLFITTVAAAWLAFKYTSTLHKRQQLAASIASFRNEQAVVNALANDAVEYSKRNPAIDPILKSFNLLPGANPPAAARPATR